jgi:release factor glutamine methyltransferase
LLSQKRSPSPQYVEELARAQERLRIAGVQSPAVDVKRITDFVTNGSAPTPKDVHSILSLIQRRENREPIERILCQSEFLGLEFELTRGVFKPGFETETTAEYALIYAEELGRPARILDLGTGTGCILIALLNKLPDATGVGVDINPESLHLATRNAQKHNVSDRAEFHFSDWTDGVHETFDIIISNPPRIPEKLIPALVREVAEYDPQEALNGGKDGLLFYRRLASDFRRIAKKDAVCFIQAGEIIVAEAKNIFVKSGFSDVQIMRDYKYSPNCISFRNDEGRLSHRKFPLDKFLNFFER